MLNPHLAITVDVPQGNFECQPTDSFWEKWLPSDPTSPHWYSAEDLSGLVAASISADQKTDRSRTVREFIAGFAGLSSSRKQKDVLEGLSLFRTSLDTLITASGGLDHTKIQALRQAMRTHSKPVKPAKLGVIGSDHIQARLIEFGGDIETLQYRQVKGVEGDLPYVIETAFIHAPESGRRDIYSGVNFSAVIDGTPFDYLGDGWSLNSLLQEQRCGYEEPVFLVIHLTTPKVFWKDRGKSSVDLRGKVAEAMIAAIQLVTKAWAKQRKAEERDASQKSRRAEALQKKKDRKKSLVEAFEEVAEDAYLKASGDGRYPAGARQIMYACRGWLQEMTGKIFTKTTDQYITQTLLPDFQAENPALTKSWDVVYDARGHFFEPHTEREVPLGTLDVREYINSFSSFSPTWIHGISMP